MAKMWQRLKYIENEKGLLDEIINVFHYFEWGNSNFLEDESPTLRSFTTEKDYKNVVRDKNVLGGRFLLGFQVL